MSHDNEWHSPDSTDEIFLEYEDDSNVQNDDSGHINANGNDEGLVSEEDSSSFYSDDSDSYYDEDKTDEIEDCNEEDECDDDEEGDEFIDSVADLTISTLGFATFCALEKAFTGDHDSKNTNKVKTTFDNEQRQEKIIYRVKEQKRGSGILKLLIFVLLLCGVGFYEYKQCKPMGYDADELIGDEYLSVVKALEKNGFKYVFTKPLNDLEKAEIEKLNTVQSVKVFFLIDDFTNTSEIPANFPIQVQYHDFYKIKVPMSSKVAVGKKYTDVENEFLKKGFTDVSTQGVYDLVTGWISKEGTVERITIGEIDEFSADDKFVPDSSVVIFYHDWKKNKP